MHLKQLTLRGFKSFASATTLQFEPGITCVVGPNGSGKSNVVDALAWVMGEQGAKTLRGGKMEDVIFAGTSSRAPLGRAEVELTIDNTDGALPIEYTEVTITRTMFRSGGSEYAINGSPARLLDVQELLSDSGIGREMHVIVGQGQLDAILQATPESRRGFIEEAAGVLKHRKRKEKAIRKLEGTKQNLDRLTDLIGELERQLKPLGRQAEAARKASVIQAELRDAKARLLADDLAGAREALAADLADEQAAAAARARAEAQVRAAADAEEQAELAMKQAAAAFDTAQSQWYAVASVRERLGTTISVASERMRLAEAQPQFDNSGRDPEKLEQDAAQIREQEAELAEKIQHANAALTDATLARNEAEKQHAEAEREYAAALRAIADRREGLARLTGQVNSVASRLGASEEEVERLRRRLDEAEQRASEAEQSFRATEISLTGLGSAESDLDQRYETANQAVQSAEAAVDQLRSQHAELTQRKVAAEARVAALELTTERRDGSQHLLDAGFAGGRLAELITVQTGWETAVSAALGVASEAVVTDSLQRAVQGVQHLVAQDEGRAVLVVPGGQPEGVDPRSIWHKIGCDESLKAALAHLLGNVLAADDAQAAARLAGEGLTAVTRDGEMYSPWLVEGGSAAGPSLLEVSAQLAEARDQVSVVGHELDRLAFARAEADQALAAAQATEEAALAALHASDAEMAAMADALGQAKQAQGAARREAERLQEAIDAAAASRAADEAKLLELEERVQAASAEEIVEPDPEPRDRLAVTARDARQTEMEARLALRSLEEQQKAIAGRADSLLRAAQQERVSREKARQRAEQQRREAEIAGVVHEAALRLAELVDQTRIAATQDRDLVEQARRDAEADATRARHASRAATAELDDLTKGAHRDEMARIETRMRIEQLEERAIAELGIEPDTLVAQYGPDQPVPVITRPDGTALTEEDETPDPVPYQREQQQTRLRRAEKNLSILGKVNPLALEEFEATKTRHGFLAEQLDDLKRTRADLIGIIEQVDQRVKEVFEAAYRDVETTFAEVFSRLFPGGEGRLVLTDPGNWLETGVDVEARPAGKQVKRLSLLSGGERSLVAVAFLVSLFIARPSPFYILDEVEAALDDANLGRLLGIYEELRERSQLLIITHQKRTMEIADSLYGVTMRGDGISTVVSQRLAEA